jgi:hypothetical protein
VDPRVYLKSNAPVEEWLDYHSHLKEREILFLTFIELKTEMKDEALGY